MQPISLARVTQLVSFVDVLHDIGAPVERLLRQTTIPSGLVNQPQLFVPTLALYSFVNHAAQHQGIDGIGALVGHNAGLTVFSPRLLSILSRARTLSHALATLCRIASMDTSRRVWLVWTPETLEFCHQCLLPCDTPGTDEMEWFAILVLLALVRRYAGSQWDPPQIGLQSGMAPSRSLHERFPHSRLVTGQRYGTVSIPQALLPLPPRLPRSPACSDPLAWPRAGDDFVTTLRQAVQAYLSDGHPAIALAAEMAGCSVRTLQRRLVQEQLTYTEVVEQARFELAAQTLRDPAVKLIEVAYDLGYADPPSFSRAFRRWTGMTPRAYRRQQAAMSSL